MQVNLVSRLQTSKGYTKNKNNNNNNKNKKCQNNQKS